MERIEIPTGSHFIRGLRDWNRGEGFGLRSGEFSCSLHRDGQTVPLRDYGYVIDIEEGGIKAAFPGDVTSISGGNRKEFSQQSRSRTWEDYKDDLSLLLEKTPRGKHNELFVDALLAEIVGGYTFGPGPSAGRRAFLSECKNRNLPIEELT